MGKQYIWDSNTKQYELQEVRELLANIVLLYGMKKLGPDKEKKDNEDSNMELGYNSRDKTQTGG